MNPDQALGNWRDNLRGWDDPTVYGSGWGGSSRSESLLLLITIIITITTTTTTTTKGDQLVSNTPAADSTPFAAAR